ncbi:probable Kinesin-like protein KIN-12E [Coccomyxa sp. Obi]|nr:probable Kinesin-like protein KIN-12E [Coccomyxa sp. Obi]
MPRGVRHDENLDPTPLKPLKLSLTPVSTRPSPGVRDTIDALGSFTNAAAQKTDVSLRERFTPPKSAASKAKAANFSLARSRFEQQQRAADDASRPLLSNSSPSVAPPSPQQPPPAAAAKLWDRRAAAASSSREVESSPFLVGPPASHSVHWTSQPSPVKPTPPAASARNPSRLQRTFHRPEAGLGRSPYDAGEGSRLRQQPPSAAAESRHAYQYSEHASTSSDNLKVIVRVRPIDDRERGLGGHKCVQQSSSQSLKVLTSEPQYFTFDAIAGEATDQEGLFQVAGQPIVENCLSGYNSCIFAYGQTGSGKTYTMSGPSGIESGLNDERRGLIPRVFDHLFARIAQLQTRQVFCKCSFLEIYNENITDLLGPSEAHLQIREDAARGVYVENLCEEEVSSVDDVVHLLARGQAARRVGETNMNRESSRSHSVFTCTLQSSTTDEKGVTNILRSRLNLVDLAGSERQKSSGAAGERLREASSINKSLSSLGLVIMSLVDVQRGAQRHVPYRDSRLTYLLQDSLGGNSKTIMVANISPASANLAETLSTLRFAQRAKSIKNKAVVNEDTRGDEGSLRAEIQRLKDELAAFQSGAQQAHAGQQHHAETTPARSHGGSPTGALAPQAPPPFTPASGHAALVAALRREEAAARCVARLTRELEAQRDVTKQREMDAQRTKMIIRLKEDKIARLQSAAGGAALSPDDETAAELKALREERALLTDKLNNHPDVRKYAVENMQLTEKLARLQEDGGADAVAQLQAGIALLRAEILRLTDENKRLQTTPKVKEVEAAAERAAAQSAAIIEDAMAQAEDLRRKAAQETHSQAMEVVRLKDRLAEAEEGRRDTHAKLAAARADVHLLEDRVTRLEQDLDQSQSDAADMRLELEGLRAAADRERELSAEVARAGDRAMAAAEEAAALRQELAERSAAAAVEEELRARTEATVAEQEAALALAREQASELRAARAQLERALAASTAEAAATIGALKASMQQQTAEALELEQLRRNEEIATLREELEEQCRMAGDARRASEAAAAELAAARAQAAAAERERAALQQRLGETEAATEEQDRALAEARDVLMEQLASVAEEAGQLQSDLQHKANVIAAQARHAQALDAALVQQQQALVSAQAEAAKWQRRYEDMQSQATAVEA